MNGLANMKSGLSGIGRYSVQTDLAGKKNIVKAPCFSCDPEPTKVQGLSHPVQCLEATKVGQEWLNKCVMTNSDILSDRDLFAEPYPNVMDKIVIEGEMTFEFRITSSADLDHDKYCCGTKWLPLKPSAGFQKQAFTYLLQMPNKFCPMNWLGTRMQTQMFQDGDILRPMNISETDGNFDKSNEFAATILNGAYRHWLKHLPQNMVTGIYQGPVDHQHHMDGIIASTYHASNPKKIYYHSVEYILSQSNIAAIEAGTFCIATMLGGEKILWIVDASKPFQVYNEEDLYSGVELYFQTYKQLEDRLEDYLNDACSFHINRKSFSATLTNGTYVITSKDVEKEVNLQIYCVAKEEYVAFDWTCLEYDKPVGFKCRVLQNRMPYYEVPVLLDHKKITKNNAGDVLLADLCDFKDRVRQECLVDEFGAKKDIYLVMDPLVFDKLTLNKQQEEKHKRTCTVFGSAQLDSERIKEWSQLRGTGLYMFVIGQNFIPIYNPSHVSLSAPRLYADHDCLNIKMRWAIMAGMHVRDYGSIGINLCGSKFEQKMKNRKPAQYVIAGQRVNSACAIPCYCPNSCGENYLEQSSATCQINGKGYIDVDYDENEETGEVTMTVSSEYPESSFTNGITYSTTVYLSDEAVYTSSLAEFDLVFDSISELQGQVINIVVEADAGSCGKDVMVSSWIMEDSEMQEIEGLNCPANFGFELVKGDEKNPDYPNTNSIYLTGITEFGQVTPYGDILECVKAINFDNSTGTNVWEFELKEGVDVVGKTFGVELSNYNCDSIKKETVLVEAVSIVVE